MSNDASRYRALAYARYDEAARPDFDRLATTYSRRLAGRLRPGSEWPCLDIACGYGNFLAFLRQSGVHDYVGIDANIAAISVAQSEFGDAHAQVADAFQYLSRQSSRYRLLSALDFIEHLRKPEVFDFLVATNSALQPGGYLLLRTPNAASPFGMAARYNDITHECCYTPNAIMDTLSRCGLESIEIWEDAPRPGNLLQIAHWITWKAVRLVYRVASAAETGTWGDGVLTRNMWVLARRPIADSR